MYYHKRCGFYLRLITVRESGVNTYLEVDENNQPTVEKRGWCFQPSEQRRLVRGFEELELVSNDIQNRLFL